MTKRILSTMMLLTSLLGGSISTALAANSAKAIWCESNQTLYFVYDNVSYSTDSSGNNTYDGYSITNYWEGTSVKEASGSGRCYTTSSVIDYCKNVVIKENFSSSGLTDCWGMFKDFKELEYVEGLNNMITPSVTTTASMFQNCKKLASLNFSGVNTSNVQYMKSMFEGCSALVSTTSAPLDLSSFNTSKVTTMQSMFEGCSALTDLDLSCFNTGDSNTGRVTTMQSMFSGCTNLATLTLGNFNTSAVTEMINLFNNCKALTTLDLSCFDTSAVIDMKKMFYNCEQLSSLDVTSFNTSEVTDMSEMFYKCGALTSLKLFSFDVSKVTSMYSMFASCKALVTIYAESNWATVATGLSSSTYMFDNCTNLKGAIAWSTNSDSDRSKVKFANLDGYFTSRSSLTMSFSPAGDQTATVGTAFTEPTLSISALDLTDPSTLTITYSSSDPTVATVDAEVR